MVLLPLKFISGSDPNRTIQMNVKPNPHSIAVRIMAAMGLMAEMLITLAATASISTSGLSPKKGTPRSFALNTEIMNLIHGKDALACSRLSRRAT